MKIVLKPGGAFVLIGVLALIIVAILMRLRPENAVATKTAPTVKPVKYINVGVLKDNNTTQGSLTTHTEALPGLAQPVTVYAMETLKPVANVWDVTASTVIAESLPKNVPLRLVFWARSKNKSVFGANHEEAQQPFAKSLSQTIETTAEWKKFDLPFRAARDYEVNGSQLTFHFGFAPGTIELAEIRLVRGTP